MDHDAIIQFKVLTKCETEECINSIKPEQIIEAFMRYLEYR